MKNGSTTHTCVGISTIQSGMPQRGKRERPVGGSRQGNGGLQVDVHVVSLSRNLVHPTEPPNVIFGRECGAGEGALGPCFEPWNKHSFDVNAFKKSLSLDKNASILSWPTIMAH
eukprot:scaffold2677_cov152-Skeletonema_dohrnii-CCMP3373.AAC.9